MRWRVPFKNITHCGKRVGVFENCLLCEPDEEGMGALLQSLAVSCSKLHCVALCCCLMKSAVLEAFEEGTDAKPPEYIAILGDPGQLLNHPTSG